ncbi:MAG: M81 family metallopeptidase, partial [Gammaproteobacteria bacterium]|nr:M81 family metallopeptidase [Gammaproteobacteria bacterium]
MSTSPRIAVCGFILESNAFAPVATEADFRSRYYFEGDEILEEADKPASLMPMEMTAFVRAMRATGSWTPVPLVLTGYQPWGPVDSDFFGRTVDDMVARLEAGGPVDGVYVANHGGMTATRDHDPDGDMLSRIREAVGRDVPVVVTLDLHANISDRMVDASSVLIGYQTNPHVDMVERGEEAAFLMRLLLGGTRARQTFLRLPLVAPSVTLLTASGPYGALMDLAQRRRRELGGTILNVSVFGGFAFSDTPKNGLAVVVTGRNEPGPAAGLATEIA